MNGMKRIAVIGAGPAGLSAAINASGPNISVVVFERNDCCGKKLLMTGNGRCNLTNENIRDLSRTNIQNKFNGTDLSPVCHALKAYDLDATVRFFDECGIHVKKRDELYYPYSDQASSVRDAICLRALEAGVSIRYSTKVTGIAAKDDKYELTLGNELTGEMEREIFDSCIIAAGSRAYPTTGSDGFGLKLCKKLNIKTVKHLPALTKCYSIDNAMLKHLEGARIKGNAGLYIDGELKSQDYGEIQFIKNGISGIVIFQLSSLAARALENKNKVEIRLDLFPEASREELSALIANRFNSFKNRNLKDALITLFNSRLIDAVLSECKMSAKLKVKDLKDISLAADTISAMIKEMNIRVTNVGGYNECQVCSGGIPGTELNEELMVISAPGIFASGEIIDIDGICGGYNLQFAFSSGLLSGEAAARWCNR